jgi:hypothetical protein
MRRSPSGTKTVPNPGTDIIDSMVAVGNYDQLGSCGFSPYFMAEYTFTVIGVGCEYGFLNCL